MKDKIEKKAKKENLNAGHRERMRNRFMKSGENLESFAEHEILEVYLYNFIPRKDTNKIAHRLLNKFGDLYSVLHASAKQLMEVEGISECAAISMAMNCEVHRLSKTSFGSKNKVSGMKQIVELCKKLLEGSTTERLVVIYINNNAECISHDTFSSKETQRILVSPTEIAYKILSHNPAGVVLAHIHPGGSNMPSQSDIKFTQQLFISLKALSINLVEHIIFDGNLNSYSMKQSGVIDNFNANLQFL